MQCQIKTSTQGIKPTTWRIISAAILSILAGCSSNDLLTQKREHRDRFVSASFNHFEDGILFTDIELGLTILWQASFKNGATYKENLGFFVTGGLLILPNKLNTYKSARLNALPNRIEDNKLYVLFDGNYLQIRAIIHTHPDNYSLHEPAPRYDYQYGYLGIHNYVIDHVYLLDAYKDEKGNEIFQRLGRRNAYHKIPVKDLCDLPPVIPDKAKESNSEATISSVKSNFSMPYIH